MEEQKSYYASPDQANFYQDRIPKEEGFQSVFELLKESWWIYKKRIKTFLGILIIPVGFLLFFDIVIYLLGNTDIVYSIWFSVAGAISYFGSVFLWFWAWPSLIYSIKDDIGVKESYQRGWKMFLSYIWVYLLFIIIISGGFLLFIIPGFLFLIWFSLSVFVVIFEGRKGFEALFRSKELMHNNFWKILGRFSILFLIIIIIGMIFGLLFTGAESISRVELVSAYFFQLFFLPFFFIYLTLIYKELKNIKGEQHYEKASFGRKARYAIPWFIGLAFMGLLFVFIMLNLFFNRDCPPPDDSDLWLPKIEISAEDNADYSFSQAAERLNVPNEKYELFIDMSKGKNWDSDFVETLIRENQETFDYFQTGLTKNQFIIPGWEDPKTVSMITPMFSLRGFPDIARLNSIKAYYLFEQGSEGEAIEQCIQTIKFGDMVEDSRLLIAYLTGNFIKKQGLICLRTIVSDSILTAEELRSYIEVLDEFSDSKKALQTALKMEYIALINTKEKIDAVYAGDAPEEDLEILGMEEFSFNEYLLLKLNYFYKPNKTKEMFVDNFRLLVANVDKNYNEMEFPLQGIMLTPSSGFKMFFTENFVGKIMRDIMLISINSTWAHSCQEEFLLKGTQLLMAMKAYKNETGVLPSNLGDLVPEYIIEVYKDPFDGKAIRYNAGKGLIYSIGEDLIDSGGSEEDSDNIEEPTLKIDF
ncbi:hypothetical protein KKE85_00010 [Patescibacteria group bacterium]|nr:hypothetical protein [Patescibacteria group bacterium]